MAATKRKVATNQESTTQAQDTQAQAGPAGSIQQALSKAGKDSVAVTRAPEKGLGDNIVKAIQEQGVRVKDAILALIGHPEPDVLQALNEIKTARDIEKSAVRKQYGADVPNVTLSLVAKGEMDKKLASISSGYSRVITIVTSISKGINVDAIAGAANLNEMYAFAVTVGAKKPEPKKQLTEAEWKATEKRMKRIVVVGKDGVPDVEGLSRIEKSFNDVLAALVKVRDYTSIPVDEILALTAKGRTSKEKAA